MIDIRFAPGPSFNGACMLDNNLINGQDFIAFIGEGENNRGAFPMNLSELNDDIVEFTKKYGWTIKSFKKSRSTQSAVAVTLVPSLKNVR